MWLILPCHSSLSREVNEGAQGRRNLETHTEAETMEECRLLAHSVSFSYTARLTSPYMAPHG